MTATSTQQAMPEMFGLPATEADSKPERPPKPETAIAKVEPKPQQIAVGDRGLKLANLDDAWRFATMVLASKLAPSSFDSREKILIAMQYGAEVGLSPMQSLQSIAVINGKPSMYGDALPALVWSSGLCEDIQETLTGAGLERKATCTAKRVGIPTPTVREFSMSDAKTAGLMGKTGPWTQYPDRMLRMRARAFCLRDAFADVLRGMSVREELDDYPHRAEHSTDDAKLPLDDE